MNSTELTILILGIVLLLLTVYPAVQSVMLIVRTQGKRKDDS